MVEKRILSLSLVVFIIVLCFSVYAITGSIGNARMILRVEVGDKIEKSILVKNVNNVSVEVELSASGDLEKYIDIKDNKFTLQPEQEKKAYFTIKVKKSGTTESRINVKFTPTDGKNGVGLSSTIIIIASGEGELSEENSKKNDLDTKNKDENRVNVLTGKIINGDSTKTNPIIILFSITGIVFLVLIILSAFLLKKNLKIKKLNKKRRK